MRISPANNTYRASEDVLIRRIAANFEAINGRNSGLRVAFGDDAAIWNPRPGFETILTCDWFLEGTHFLRKTHPPEAVGWKCLARALSDIAAMGGQPRCFLLSLALPGVCTGDWLEAFLRGLRRASSKLHCPLAGGDTTRRNEILINVTTVGEVELGSGSLRSGARPGDHIFVSGHLGEAQLGWELAKRSRGLVGGGEGLAKKHLYPEPRIELGRWLVQNKFASAMMDLSDGLSSDLARLCEASGVGAAIQLKNVPLAKGKFSSAFSEKSRLAAALHGGDDYELLFCVPKDKAKRIPPKFHRIALTKIGEVATKRGVQVVELFGKVRRLRPGGWDPFRS